MLVPAVVHKWAMDGKRLATALAFLLAPISFLGAQERVGSSAGEIETIKAELRSQDDRINRLSAEVNRLVELLREKGIAVDKTNASTPKASPAPKAAPASPSATVPGTVGVDNPSPTAMGGVRTHVVAKGETLTQIAKQYGVTVDDIEQLNKIQDAKKLQIGQTLKIPGSGSSASPSPNE
jgi:LysM repeat protein